MRNMRSSGLSWILACYTTTNWRRVLLVAAAPPLAVMVNALRVLILVLLGHFFGTHLLDTPLHTASGLATFWLVMLVLVLLVDRTTLRKILG